MLQLPLLVYGLLFVFTQTDAATILEVTDGGSWGEWTDEERCPENQFAVGYQMLVEEYQHTGDDTGLNAVRLICAEGRTETNETITSGMGPWGEWTHAVSCNHYPGAGFYIVAFALAVQTPQGNKDDTAADWIKFMCRDMSTTELLPDEEISVHPGHGRFGEYGSWSHYCTEGTAVCGIQTKIEAPQGGSEDDTALNDVRLICCKVPEDVQLTLEETFG